MEVASLAVLLLLLVTAPALAQTTVLESPSYAEGDFWEYEVDARVDSLLGIGTGSGSLAARGLTRAQVTQVSGVDTTLSWTGDLNLEGTIILPGETGEASVSGTITTAYEERRQAPYLLPVAITAQTGFDVTVTFIVTIPYGATIVLNATIPPTASAPTYPLVVEERTFETEAVFATNVTIDFLGMGFQNSSVEAIASTLHWNVTPSESVEVPAGSFSGLQVSVEAVTGFVPSPFLGLIPGAVQVTHHSPQVGSPVLFQFFVNGTEIGAASLQTFSYTPSVPLPFWQNPLFLGSLLAIPIGLLLYRYWRERRKGL